MVEDEKKSIYEKVDRNKKWKTIISVILIMVPTLLFGSLGKSAEMGIALIAGSIAAAFIQLEKFSSIKGAGFEAKLRETIKEAEVTIEQLREVAKTNISAALYLITYAGRWGGGPNEQKEKIKNACEEIISALGIIDSDIQNQFALFDKFTLYDAYKTFVDEISIQAHNQELINELDRHGHFEKGTFPPLDEITAILNKYNIKFPLNESTQESLDQYLAVLNR